MLKNIRRAIAIVVLLLLTLLFLDFTGTLHAGLGWLTKIQFVPAILAGAFVTVIFWLLMTALFGRIYCSVACPLGLLQDAIAWFGKKSKKNRYSFSPNRKALRIAVCVVFIGALITSFFQPIIGIVANLLEPYSAFGRIATNLFSPLWRWGNNALAFFAERANSYAFYETDVWLKCGWSLGVAAITFIIVAVLAWRGGRTYCNTICPVGTLLGFASRRAVMKIVIDESKCSGCGLCEKNCKSACINSKQRTIDYSRCVVCMDCIGKCKRGAIKYGIAPKKVRITVGDTESKCDAPASTSRRAFLTGAVAMAATTAIQAQKKKVDGGLAVIKDKVVPERATPILPPGAVNARSFAHKCTACQLCVSACPNNVLRPSSDLNRFMQPEASYERGYCRPECTSCSNVCPNGALLPLTREEKSSTQIGRAVWIKQNCLAASKNERCDNCARHCPTGAIQMVAPDEGDKKRRPIPVIDVERCIGCGACENLCPARPFSGIVVEGVDTQKLM